MGSKMYALIGSWGFEEKEKGLSVYRYNPKNATLDYLETSFVDVSVGQQWVDNGLVYVVDERDSRRGEIGGGGYVLAIRVDPQNGTLRLVNKKESLLSNPSYIWVDQSQKYAVVAHHGGRGHVTKIVQKEDGSFGSQTLFDDAALVLFRLNDDGSMGDVCDVLIAPTNDTPENNTASHLHSVIADPSGKLWLACDKGKDRIYAYRLDTGRGKLQFLMETPVEKGSAPRYGVFHPFLPVFYENNEQNPFLCSYRFDVETGKLTRMEKLPLVAEHHALENEEKAQSSDIVMHPSGKYLYTALRGVNQIAVVEIFSEGGTRLLQNIDCHGINPRGLCLSPDARYLFSLNLQSDNVCVFSISENGTLIFTGMNMTVSSPGNMKFLCVSF
ncbi:MAG: lactonase family protein [Spirochaetaceae bacterium]|jgi:6-phosphogluconolactonase (cycloisomerase 2 family)|nr:lactonase family protein [Spirochaetaceae bacterium]